jgi:hypothetical protein
MFTTIIVILLLLWLVGVVTDFTFGGLINILLVLAIAAILIKIIRGEDPF